MKTAQITLELSGETLENLLYLATRLQRHPDDLTVDLLHAAIKASMDSADAQTSLMMQPSNGILQ
ncbi:hypothetical protein [Desulfobulbus oligotrophicus]|uniref:Uncharacterized protein n=1 Tax=Desulfobulbus oligotrophicus TaxID=1909699 RepID=A0A7T5VC12_9BACT|nr:hypothetical protein [Desulfobulbus oligotrophicus]QQG65019.1 hypothetical protein HP555_03625 [Desulfobulbus oligotrophicus]